MFYWLNGEWCFRSPEGDSGAGGDAGSNPGSGKTPEIDYEKLTAGLGGQVTGAVKRQMAGLEATLKESLRRCWKVTSPRRRQGQSRVPESPRAEIPPRQILPTAPSSSNSN